MHWYHCAHNLRLLSSAQCGVTDQRLVFVTWPPSHSLWYPPCQTLMPSSLKTVPVSPFQLSSAWIIAFSSRFRKLSQKRTVLICDSFPRAPLDIFGCIHGSPPQTVASHWCSRLHQNPTDATPHKPLAAYCPPRGWFSNPYANRRPHIFPYLAQFLPLMLLQLHWRRAYSSVFAERVTQWSENLPIVPKRTILAEFGWKGRVDVRFFRLGPFTW